MRLRWAAGVACAASAQLVTVDEVPHLAGDPVVAGRAFCDARGLGNTPEGLPCAAVVAADLVARTSGPRADAAAHARVLFDRRKFAEAAAVAERAAPPTAESLGLAAAARFSRGEYDRAVALYEAARRAGGGADDDLDANYALATFHAGGDALAVVDAVRRPRSPCARRGTPSP